MKLAALSFALAGGALICASAVSVNAEDAARTPAITTAELDTYVKGMWPHVEPGWEGRLAQDETQALCSRVRNNPSAEDAEKITQREAATVKYPGDGNVLGDWREGEKIASSGKGGQFSDAPDTKHGGNCYACHQLAPDELAFGTIGPSLTGYGKQHGFSPEAARTAYAKLFNAQASVACSNMPRFGVHGFLTEQQLKDVNAFLFDRESPVNK